jgi:hypothetical protein
LLACLISSPVDSDSLFLNLGDLEREHSANKGSQGDDRTPGTNGSRLDLGSATEAKFGKNIVEVILEILHAVLHRTFTAARAQAVRNVIILEGGGSASDRIALVDHLTASNCTQVSKLIKVGYKA